MAMSLSKKAISKSDASLSKPTSISNWCSVGAREERSRLVIGYTRFNNTTSYRLPADIIKLINKFYDCVAYWDFNTEIDLAKFYNFQYKEVLFGPKIIFNNIVFQCTLCPSGWSHRGCVQFYIEFDKEEMNGKLPKYIKSVTAYLVIYCKQIEYEYRTPKIFINIESAQGWPAYRIDDIKSMDFKSLNFGCYIELLRVEYTKDYIPPSLPGDNALYEQFFNKTHKISEKSQCEWIVNGVLLEKFKTAKHSQGFYSPNFDNDSWCLSCSPSGIKKEYDGKFCIALKILRLPYNIKSIKVKHEITIKSDDNKFGINIKDVKEFDYHRKASRFTKEMKEIGSFEKSKWIKFKVELEIIPNNKHKIKEDESGEEEDDDEEDDLKHHKIRINIMIIMVLIFW